MLAAYPPPDCLSLFSRGRALRFLAGEKDSFVVDGSWVNAGNRLSARRIEAEFTLLPTAGHFFLLTQPEQTAQWLRRPLSTRSR